MEGEPRPRVPEEPTTGIGYAGDPVDADANARMLRHMSDLLAAWRDAERRLTSLAQGTTPREMQFGLRFVF